MVDFRSVFFQVRPPFHNDGRCSSDVDRRVFFLLQNKFDLFVFRIQMILESWYKSSWFRLISAKMFFFPNSIGWTITISLIFLAQIKTAYIFLLKLLNRIMAMMWESLEWLFVLTGSIRLSCTNTKTESVFW